MQDYSAIVETLCKQNNAKIVDLLSLDALVPYLIVKCGFTSPQDAIVAMMAGDVPKPEEQDAFSDSDKRELYVRLPIKTELGCVIALHELGHIVHEDKGDTKTVEAEARATQYALDHCGFKPNKRTAKVMLDALGSYEGDKDVIQGGPTVNRLHSELNALQA